ncbi:MAG: nodulation protein NfeD [Candidatus Tectomicrobia bacterium]|nr:nodulation protein NfeD [Candidatus Tectomicrobia bacterium]
MSTHRFRSLRFLGLVWLCAAGVLSLIPAWGAPEKTGGRAVLVLNVDGVINPASAEYIVKGIAEGKERQAELIVLRLDTPGGLDTSMRAIIKEMMASPVPVAVYVAPGGARAASAGTFITLAAHVAAMAPGTNLGAASPVAVSGGMDETMKKKVTNDAAAYIRSLADKRGRNADWAEDAVRKGVSIGESVALEKRVIDLVAADLRALLLALDGRSISTEYGEKRLRTRGAEVVEYQMGVRQRLLDVLSNPNLAYLLMMLGFYGILFELTNPGAIFPGVVGAICLIVGFYALQVLPINYAGLALILLGIILFLLEIKVVSYGALSIGGAISLVLGSVMLVDTPAPFLRISYYVIIPTVVLTGLFFFFLIGLGLKAQRGQFVSGREGLVNAIGVARGNLDPEGKVFIHGELWNARSKEPIAAGEKVRVLAVDGLRLEVVKEKPS